MTKKVIVTGGAGFIGSHTIVELINSGYSPIIVDNLNNSYEFVISQLESLTGVKIPFYKIDCLGNSFRDVFLKDGEIDGVIHFAAHKAVGESVDFPLKYYKNNIGSLVHVLELCKEFSIKKLVFSSSCTVYGTVDQLPATEKTPVTKAFSPYGNTKKVCEEVLSDFNVSNKNTGIVSLRYFNPVGAHSSAKIGELPIGKPNNLIPFLTQTAVGEREQLTVFGDTYNTPDGSCIRDYIHVVDLAKAHVLSLDYLTKEENQSKVETFNIGTGKGNSVLEVVNTFEKVNNISVNYKIGPKRSGDVESIYGDVSKAKKDLGWQAELTLEDCLRDAWNWQKFISSNFEKLKNG